MKTTTFVLLLLGSLLGHVSEDSKRRARQTATRHAIPRCYSDMETMTREVRPAVVHLLTPPATHLPLARIAVKHRAHMYIEKPFASSEAEARATASQSQQQASSSGARQWRPRSLSWLAVCLASPSR